MTITRRDFLKAAAAIPVVALVVPVAVIEKTLDPVWVAPPETTIRGAALSVPGVTRVHITGTGFGEIEVEVDAKPHEVADAINKIRSTYISVTVVGPVKLPGIILTSRIPARITI